MIGGRDDRRHGLSGARPLTAVRREVRALLEYARALEKLSEQQYQTRLGRLRRARSMAEAKHCANGLPHLAPDALGADLAGPVVRRTVQSGVPKLSGAGTVRSATTATSTWLMTTSSTDALDDLIGARTDSGRRVHHSCGLAVRPPRGRPSFCAPGKGAWESCVVSLMVHLAEASEPGPAGTSIASAPRCAPLNDGATSMRCTPSAAAATTMLPLRSRMLTRVPGAHPIARMTLAAGDRPLLSTALTTYTMSTARVEPESNDSAGRGARPRPDEPVPACRAWPVRGITGGTTEVVTATTSAPDQQSHTVTRRRS
jgi:hypothetical protein